ncbi:40388_t:CDS:1, partial [Gigaspora margarita]
SVNETVVVIPVGSVQEREPDNIKQEFEVHCLFSKTLMGFAETAMKATKIVAKNL